MLQVSDLRASVIEWYNTFPLDRDYRIKHNIAFNSEVHQKVNQIDVYLEWLEEQLIQEGIDDYVEVEAKQAKYVKGEWISERIPESPKTEDEIFDNIDITNL